MLRAIRGAIDVEKDEPQIIYAAATRLLQELVEANNLEPGRDIISTFFTATSDLKSAYPAKAARDMGWNNIPLMCMQEMEVQGSLPLCIRVLLHVDVSEDAVIKHVYLGKAKELRPDL
ncbi:MAG: chorismate mutase [Bacillota bacterium]